MAERLTDATRLRISRLSNAVSLVLLGIERGKIEDQSLITTTWKGNKQAQRVESLSEYLRRALTPIKKEKRKVK